MSVWNSGANEIFATHNGGTTWPLASQQAASAQFGNSPAILATVGSAHAWAALETGAIVRSSDGGRTWATVTPTPQMNGVRTLQFASAQVGWAVDAENGNWEILQTADGGSTWRPVYTPT